MVISFFSLDSLIHISEYTRQYNIKHKEQRDAYRKYYYYSNLEKERERGRQYHIDNLEKAREHNRQYHRDHPEIVREISRRRRSRLKELPFDFYAEDEQFALEYWNNCCAVCGEELDFTKKPKGHTVWSFDHWIPITDERKNNPGTVPWNMLPMCHGKNSCNSSKLNSDPIEWLYRKFPDDADSIIEKIETFFSAFDIDKLI